jgi:mRNA-degrading endonuclease RelE of RelBE toxin-antitoxin system
LKAFTKVSRLPEFEKDLKKLSKRFKTLEDDLRIFIDTQLNLFHKLGIDNGGIFQIPGLHIETAKFYKAKKFACRSLKGTAAQSGIRVIYTYFEEEDRIELIEIYYKGDKKNEDRERIRKAYQSGR